MSDSNLVRLLEPQVTRPVGLANRLTVARGAGALRDQLTALRDEGVAHVVVDAVADDDLTVIAEACRDMPLMTGGSAVAMPLPYLYIQDGNLSADAPRLVAPTLAPTAVILSGSCSAMTRTQVAAYARTGAPVLQIDPLASAAEGPEATLEWLAEQDLTAAPLLFASADPAQVKAAQDQIGTATAGELVERALAACAVAACDAWARQFVVAGGETLGAVTQALGTARLDIGAEIAPGVPWTYCQSGGNDIALTLKSGNFGTESFFADTLAEQRVA